MSAQNTIPFDADTYRRAIEEADAETLIAMFDENADVETFDRRTPPSTPAVLHGREAFAPMMREVCSREMTHEVLQVVTDGEHASYTERCTYPDGSVVMGMTMLDLSDGRIVHQATVQAWDEEEPGRMTVGDFDMPDAAQAFDLGNAETVQVGGHNVTRVTLRPGWRWSEQMRAEAGTDLCMLSHTCLMVSGTMCWRMPDDSEHQVRAGQVAHIPPGHDAWVVGDESAVLVDWTMDD
ncbi:MULTISPECIES: nuclear transport factor 2 family protein [unclassified Nocardiopsis]|uniref:nuclear transport factor 2 family protein n=1 Tax=Nocardiopsis TaxID=2013 RepID=UPI00387AB455